MGILFAVIALCVFQDITFKTDLLQESIYGNAIYNNIMDNIVEDSLRKSVSFENYMPVIDKEKLLDEITGIIAGYYMGEGKNFGEYLKKNIRVLILTDPDGYYLCGDMEKADSCEWSAKKLFSKGKITPKEEKVKEITDDVKETYHMDLLLQSGNKTGLENTLDDYQVLMVYQSYPYRYQGKKYRKLLFSGAKLKHDITFG